VGGVATALLGCSAALEPVGVAPIKPTFAAQNAISQYDTNGDQHLSVDELANCTALHNVFGRYDRNADGQISQDELAARFEMWASGGLGVSTLACRVTWKGRPLSGAEVKLVAEHFFDGAIQPAAGTTDASGTALLAIDGLHLPADLQNLRGVQQGLYRVEITHPEIEIPTKYNTRSTLGKEVSFESGENLIFFTLVD